MLLRLTVNGTRHNVDAREGTPLLWVLRDDLGLTGTKYGCGIGACGACTVHVNGQPMRSCSVPASAVDGRSVTTIEGIDDAVTDRLRAAWIEEDVAQCGYCQGGHLMAASALLRRIPRPSDAEIDNAMSSLICRCGTYERMRRAIRRAAGMP
jgi:aerobic-type carbon monoxide dehydrogenase small subunit (CoxS/CutS family)